MMEMINEENGFNQTIFKEAQAMVKKRFNEMLMFYIEDVVTYIGDIHAGLATKDASKIYQAAHTIKSSSNQIGVINVSDIAKDIEFTGRSIIEEGESGAMTFSAIAALAMQLEEAFKMSKAALEDFVVKQQR